MDSLALPPQRYLQQYLTEESVAGQRQAAAGVGHVHLQVGDVQSAHDFYVGTLGFEKTAGWHGQALFVSAGGYHHHMAMNVWNSRGAGPRRDTLGLGEVLIEVPSGDDVGGPGRPAQGCRRRVPPHRRRAALRGSVAQPDPRRRALEVLPGKLAAGHLQRAQDMSTLPLGMSTLRRRDRWACPLLGTGTPEHVHCSQPGMDIDAICPVVAVRRGHAQRALPGGQGSPGASEGHVHSSPAGHSEHVHCSQPGMDIVATCPVLTVGGGHVHGRGRVPRASEGHVHCS